MKIVIIFVFVVVIFCLLQVASFFIWSHIKEFLIIQYLISFLLGSILFIIISIFLLKTNAFTEIMQRKMGIFGQD